MDGGVFFGWVIEGGGRGRTVGPQVAMLPGMAFVGVARNWEQKAEAEVVDW